MLNICSDRTNCTFTILKSETLKAPRFEIFEHYHSKKIRFYIILGFQISGLGTLNMHTFPGKV